MKKGKLIIIEGIDGSGKSTQTKLLIDKLKQQGKKVKSIHFPQHGQETFGKLVDAYLHNEFGLAPQVDYRLASILYAGDRFEARNKINHWLRQGFWVVLDRYAESNFGHQGGKINNSQKRIRIIDWLYHLDYDVFKNPKPNLVIFLDIPVKFVIKLMHLMGKQQDAHESDQQFLKNSRQAYLQANKKYNYWHSVQCIKKNKLLGIDDIHNKIWRIINNKSK